jgi:hypothetical protein
MREATWSSVIALGVLLGSPMVLAQAEPPPPPPPPAPEPPPPPPPEPPPPSAIVEAPIAVPAPAPAAAPAPGGLKIDGPNTSIKLGFLLQPGFEYDAGTATTDTKQDYFFLRRARLMVGMTLESDFEVFAETDAPNLGRPAGVGGNAGAFMQDAYITWKPATEFKVDAGMMLVPFSHNAIQGAGTLYGWDYYAFTFLQSGPLTNYAGRDTGVQLRGLLIDRLEYRVGLFQGNRAAPPMAPPGMPAPPAPSRTAMRFMARIQFNVLDPETGYFYAGTYGGSKKILSLGAAIDHQDDYNGIAGDAFLDLPIGDDVLTAQLNVLRFDGGTWIGLAKQTDIMAEAGYRLGALKISPIVRFEDQIIASPSMATPNVMRIGVGLVWWLMAHNLNLKLFYTYVKPDNDMLKAWSQINLQMQFYVF